MDDTQFGAAGRRALNQVWNGAGAYGFQPVFVSNTLYMNTIAGLAEDFFGRDALQALFDTWAGDVWQGTYDRFAWVLIEGEMYRRNVEERPALAELRTAYADFFLESLERRSRSENMGKAMLCESIQRAHWREAEGDSPGFLLPREAKLYAEVKKSTDLSPEALEQRILELLKTGFGFTGVRSQSFKLKLPEGLARLLPQRKADVLQPQRFDNGVLSEIETAARRGHGWSSRRPGGAEALQYAEGCFGRCRYSPDRLEQIRSALCTGAHAGCEVWFTDGIPSDTHRSDSRHVSADAVRQQKKNRQHYLDNAAMYDGIIRRIQREIQNNLLSEIEPRSESARWGSLDCTRVWRAPILGDNQVFLRPEELPTPAMSVLILLDASASRMYQQEVISAQAYILAEALRQCRVPVQVESFCSIRGVTVFNRLVPFSADNSRNVFRYFAAGWNRDGLALRMAGFSMEQVRSPRKIVILLTDANPNDSAALSRPGRFSVPYEEASGMEDTAAEVARLRRSGCQVGAVFFGNGANFPNAGKIYGKHLVRIREMEEFAAAAVELIRMEMQQ